MLVREEGGKGDEGRCVGKGVDRAGIRIRKERYEKEVYREEEKERRRGEVGKRGS